MMQLSFCHTSGMARCGGLGSWCRCIAQGMNFLLFGVGLVAVWSGGSLAAQDEPIHTLHVYTNLIQVPVLVLSRFRTPVAPIAPNRFMISVDSGPRFRATHVRPEGDDPISLSILLDARGPDDDLLPKIDTAIAGLAPLSLQARDHVSVYALDCTLTQSLKDAPAEQGKLKQAVNAALQSWTYHKQKNHGAECKPSLQLWDAFALVLEDLSRLPGRRVILAVTDGSDRGSRNTWNEVRRFAQRKGVAIFGVVYVPYSFDPFHRASYEDAFNSVCELSGGMIFKTNGRDMAELLKGFVTTVRERYIVEFPRPSNSTAGEHDLVVTIEKKNDVFIRSAGISVPIPDPALLADPTTVPSDPKLTPEMGTRHPMTNPH
jgi:hypothetical protein